MRGGREMTRSIVFSAIALALFAAVTAFSQGLSDMNVKLGKLDIETATFDDVLALFGKPLSLRWKNETYSMDDRPESFVAGYPEGFSVVIDYNRVDELRFTAPGAGFVFAGKLRIGSSLDTALEVLGPPKRTVVGGEVAYRSGVLYKDIGGKEGHCYYGRRDRGIRLFFLGYKIHGLYLFPRSDRPQGMTSLPKYDPDADGPFKVDLRNRDLSRLDLRNRLGDLLYAAFDDRTVWPAADRMPRGFDHEAIMKTGRNPGLGIRALHREGITGRGVGIAIVDQPLLRDHVEYKDRLRLYEEIQVRPDADPSMHGAAVASIAVGKTVGVAPEADLYYIASWTGDFGEGEGGFTFNFAYYARAVHRILEVDSTLPEERKIRVIALQVGWRHSQKGYDDIRKATEKAKSLGMLVICSCVDDVHGFEFHGLGRPPFADPDRWDSYAPGLFWANDSGSLRVVQTRRHLLVPMDSRTTASPLGPHEYVYYREGGWSWSIPYIAGLYALAAQVDPRITPDRFWRTALDTGRTIGVEHAGQTSRLGRVADPAALMAALRGK
jgi:hypothetical protein